MLSTCALKYHNVVSQSVVFICIFIILEHFIKIIKQKTIIKVSDSRQVDSVAAAVSAQFRADCIDFSKWSSDNFDEDDVDDDDWST